MTHKLPGGKTFEYGLFSDDRQIGFICYANYVARKAGQALAMHIARVVIHPDFCGFGLGLKLANATAPFVIQETNGGNVFLKMSSSALIRACQKDPRWKFRTTSKKVKAPPKRNTTFNRTMVPGSERRKVKIYLFQFFESC